MEYAKYHRWNFEVCGESVTVCKDLHDKGQPCEYETLTATEIVELLEELIRPTSPERCEHCGAGDDNHHSYSCPTKKHPDHQCQEKSESEGCNTPDVSDQPTNLPEGWKAYRLNWFCGNPSFMLSNNQQDHVYTTNIRWYGYISMDDKQAHAQRGFLWGDEFPDYKDRSLDEHPFPADADNPATWILFSKV